MGKKIVTHTINLHDQCLPFKKILFIHGACRERKDSTSYLEGDFGNWKKMIMKSLKPLTCHNSFWRIQG